MAALRREAWSPRYETDQGVSSRPVGESVAAPEICCRRRKHRCGAQKAVATAAEYLVLLETGDDVIPGDKGRWENIVKRQKSVLRGTNSDGLFSSDDKMSQMLTQLESQPEFGSGSGSGLCGDDEPGDDEDGGEDEDEDEDDEEDADSWEMLYMG
nr:hypothetical protein [Tanacetum cinerariifolium]